MIILDRLSTSVVFASRAGVPNAGQGESTARLQAILDSFAGNPLTLVIDQSILLDNLRVWSNTTIEVLPGVQVQKKPSSGGNLNSGIPLISNKNWVAGPTTPTDMNITIRGGFWDGNRRNGGGGNAPGTGPLVNGVPNSDYPWSNLNPIVNANAYDQPSFMFAGVTNLLIEDVQNYDSPAYSFQLSNVQESTTQRCEKTIALGDTIPGNDMWHLNGYCADCRLYDSYGYCNDDIIAINANDGEDLFPASQPHTFLPGTVSDGPIVGVRVRGIRILGGEFNVGRLLSGQSADYTDDVIIEDVSGVTVPSGKNGMFFDSYNTGSTGLHKQVKLRDFRFGSAAATFGMVLVGDCTINDLEISGFNDLGVANTGGMVIVNNALSTIGMMRLNNCVTSNTAYLVQQTNGALSLVLGVNTQTGASGDFHSTGGSNTVTRVTIA